MRTPGNPLDRERVIIDLERRGDSWLAVIGRSPDGLVLPEPDGPELRGDNVGRILERIGSRLNGRDTVRRATRATLDRPA